jgi:hypothetical protein
MRNPYTPIFKRTLQSRIWSLSPSTRCVWMWMKLQADPEGYVNADLAGVAAGANVELEDARRAIDGFLAPDPDADPDDPYEGRVLERVRGGWLILDHESDRELAKVEAHNARNARYARARRARERAQRLEEAQGVAVALAEGRDPREVMNDVEPTGAYTEAPVCAPKPKPKPKPKPTTKPKTGEEISPLPPSGGFPVPLHVMPDDFAPSDELRADATMAGVQNLDERIASLRTGPIGGTRGVLRDKLEDYIRSFFGKWKAWEETDRAKQRALAAAAAPKPGGRGPWVPPAPEPKAKHKRVAERWGIPLEPILRDLAERKIVETLGTDAWHEHLERAIAKQAAAIRDGRAA